MATKGGKPPMKRQFVLHCAGPEGDQPTWDGAMLVEGERSAFRPRREADLDAPVLSLDDIDKGRSVHTATPSFRGAYKSGRSSWRGIPVARSTSRTRSAGTRRSSHRM